MDENDSMSNNNFEQNSNENISISQNSPKSIKTRPKTSQDFDEDNDCETLIKMHQHVPGCSLMIDGYHSIKKKYYFCVCDPDCQMPLCLSCLNICHSEHWKKKRFEEIPTDKRSALCFCGVRNHIIPDSLGNTDFVYDEQCQFLEWSIVTKTYIYYEHPKNPDEVFCMFCYNVCQGKPHGYIRKSDELLCRRLKCSCIHSDYLKVFELIGQVTNYPPFKFENFIPVQFLNMMIMSTKSFENAFHRVFSTLNILKEHILKKKKKEFNFTIFTNNSPFMKALEKISNILGSCDNLFYITPLVDINEFIFSLLQRKFSYKTHENIWILKKNLFYCFHKFNFRKTFEPIPVLSVKDLSNMTPFQRIMYTEYIKFCPKIEEQFLANYKKNHEKEYIDEILHTLGKYKSIKDKGCYSYEILRKLFSECKILIRCNKFSYEQLLKFYSLNDEIIYNSMSSKERKITLKNGLAQMKMLNQMVKCILYLSFYFNDNVFKQYVNNEINITEVSFFHSNNETAKMIYRNCTHILLFCRTIHQKCVLNKKVDLDEPGHSTEKMTQSETFMAIARIKNLIDKYHNKIMFMSTDITALTLNDPDSYIYGLKRCFRENSHIYLKLIQNSVSSKSLLIFDEIKEMYNEIEEVYQQFFLFEIQGEEIERQIIESIERFFELIGQSDFVPPFSLDGPNLKEKYKERDNKKKNNFICIII